MHLRLVLRLLGHQDNITINITTSSLFRLPRGRLLVAFQVQEGHHPLDMPHRLAHLQEGMVAHPQLVDMQALLVLHQSLPDFRALEGLLPYLHVLVGRELQAVSRLPVRLYLHKRREP